MKARIDKPMMRTALKHLRHQTPSFAPLIRQFPRCPLDRGRADLFDTLVWSIIGQQLSVKAAKTIGTRLVARCGDNRLRPAALAALSESQCRKAGLSGAKTRYVQGLANASLNGDLNFRSLSQQQDADIIDTLTALPGVGVWTAQMFLIFGLRRPDVAAPADVGLQRGMQMLFELDTRPDADTFVNLAAAWQPYRSIASWYLWRLAG